MISLRNIDNTDCNRLFFWRNLPDVRRWMYTDHEISRAEHEAWFESMLKDSTKKYWVVMFDGEPVGVANLSDISYEHKSCSFGIYLAEGDARGQGVGPATMRHILEYVFGELSFERLSCQVISENVTALGLYQRCGFREEGLLREHIVKAGKRTNVTLLGILRREWEELPDSAGSKRRDRNAV